MEFLSTEYGRCPCTGRYENRTVEVRMTVGGKDVVLKNISQGACPLCGRLVYKTEVIERLETLMRQRELDSRDDRALSDRLAAPPEERSKTQEDDILQQLDELIAPPEERSRTGEDDILQQLDELL